MYEGIFYKRQATEATSCSANRKSTMIPWHLSGGSAFMTNANMPVLLLDAACRSRTDVVHVRSS